MKHAWPMRTQRSSKDFDMVFSLQNIKTVHNRNKWTQPCIDGLPNHDNDIFDNVVKMAGCAPPYIRGWKNTSPCTTQDEIKKFYDLLYEYFLFEWYNSDGLPCRRLEKLDFVGPS